MDRRDFIKMLGLAGTSAAAYAACSSYMQEALAESSTTIDDLLTADLHCKPGSLSDIEHVVILMQENRSFDHYFGTLRGVRGLGDPRPLQMADGEPVWHQVNYDFASYKKDPTHRVHPFRLPSTALKPKDDTSAPGTAGGVFLQDPAHDYTSGIAAWNNGRSDDWIHQKQIVSMAHYAEADIPLYFKLAKTFTLCDAYFCSLNGPTDPNRSYFWTGTCKGRNDNTNFSLNYFNFSGVDDWKTYPEKLEELGVDWKFYQDGLGWDMANAFAGNFGDNTISYFAQYADTSKPIYKKSQTVNPVLRTVANTPSRFEQDILDDKLPPVSWIVAPEAFTEHPKFPPHFGEYYVHEVLRAFAANKEVWKKTVFIITYDENGGFFDHVLPPVPPITASDGLVSPGIKLTPPSGAFNFNSEIPAPPIGLAALFAGPPATTPLGMGIRVPTLVISPWSIGGRVCSEVFDHTSIIRFLDTWLIAKGLQAKDAPIFPNISSWRQAIAGDLTSTLDFNRKQPVGGLEAVTNASDKAVIFTDTQRSNALATGAFSPDLSTVNADPDKDKPVAAKQDRGRCDILPVGYDIQAFVKFSGDATKQLQFTYRNSGRLGAAFYAIPYDNDDAPLRYSIEAMKTGGAPVELSAKIPIKQRSGGKSGDYAYAIHGPNGYLCEFKGNALSDTDLALPDITDVKSVSDGATVQFTFSGGTPNGTLKLIDAYNGTLTTVTGGQQSVEVATNDGWYDVAFVDAVHTSRFVRRYAGHIENGRIGKSDPAIGKLYNAVTRIYEDIPVVTAAVAPPAAAPVATPPAAPPASTPPAVTPASDEAILLNL